MDRRLKLEVIIDFKELMKKNKIHEVEHYISDSEMEVIRDLIEKIKQITNCTSIRMCIEDLEHREYDIFDRSSKMGSKSAISWNFDKMENDKN